MKTTQKRVWAILSALMMLVSILGGIVVLPVQAATVDYVYSGKYVYNWGQREETATFLSPMAEDFYADNNVTYDELSAYSGDSDKSDVPYSPLFEELHDLMYNNLDNPTTYNGTRDLFQYTDCENSGGAISSFYSGEAIGPDWDGGATWNREHCWPNSKSNGGSNSNTDRETDIMMLRPTSVKENSSRSNTAYGEGSSFYDPNELGQNVRGDAARIVLYVYVCWGGSSQHDGALDYMWGSSGVMESKEVLLKWMEEDPVDTWELGRNDSVESITGTRNVFVDYPELAFSLFDEEVPDDYDSPSGEGSGPAYKITATSNDTSHGTVSVSGKTITATPKTGYAVNGYTILNGTATVTRTGNTFKVAPTSNVSIRIDFIKKTATTVQLVGLNGTTNLTAYVGDAITLPAHSGTLPDGYTFLGWSEQEIAETDNAPTYLKVGSSYAVSAGAVLYAVYSRFESTGTGNSNSYELYSGTITEGDYIIAYTNGALKAEMGSSDRLAYSEVSIESNTIKNPAADIVWHIAPNGSDWTIYNVSANVYAAGNGTKNKGALLTEITDFAKWTVTGSSTYEFVNVGNKANSVNANLRRNGTYGYACYSTSTGGALNLYKRAAGTEYYFTAAACDHEYDNACDTTCNLCDAVRTVPHSYVGTVTTAATCGADGVKTYTCSLCGDSYTETIPATKQHNYVSKETTAATCGQDGVMTYICSVCADSYTETIPATGNHNYVAQVTTAATCGRDGVKTYTCSVCADSYTETIPATGDHIYDNTCDADCNVCGGTRVTDHTYTAACDAFCDVCGYERTISSEATLSFDDTSKRTEFSTSKQVWSENGITVTNNKNSSTSNVADYAKPARFYASSEIIVEYPGMTEIVFDCNNGTYATALKNSIGDAATVSSDKVTVTFDESVDSFTVAKLTAQVRMDSITVTAEGAEHEYSNDCDATCDNCGAQRETNGHDYTSEETTAATCSKDGVMTYTCSICGDSYTEAIPATGKHDYAPQVTTAATCGQDGVLTYTCSVCGDSYTEAIPATGAHTYAHDFDVDCDVCGGTRQVALPITYDGSSTSEDVNGLAFRFVVAANGMGMNVTTAVYDNATVGGYKLVKMGAIVTNDQTVGTNPDQMILENVGKDNCTKNVDATYLLEASEDACAFAVRVINIPEWCYDVSIYARPYCVLECNGQQIILYQDIVSATYNG